MPASKDDPTTPSGRLQIARKRQGYTQADFAKAIGYSPSGWQKVELGDTDLTYEHIQRANEILRLDVRYYFGGMSYEEARDGAGSILDNIVKKIDRIDRRVVPIGDRVDENSAASQVLKRPVIERFVQRIQHWEDAAVERLYSMAVAFDEGRQYEEEKRKKGQASTA